VNISQLTSEQEIFHYTLVINFCFSLGLIANSHLVFADQSENGAKDEKCLKLARMHRYVREKVQRILMCRLFRVRFFDIVWISIHINTCFSGVD
jgi:hypothetical protein